MEEYISKRGFTKYRRNSLNRVNTPDFATSLSLFSCINIFQTDYFNFNHFLGDIFYKTKKYIYKFHLEGQIDVPHIFRIVN